MSNSKYDFIQCKNCLQHFIGYNYFDHILYCVDESDSDDIYDDMPQFRPIGVIYEILDDLYPKPPSDEMEDDDESDEMIDYLKREY